MSGGSSSTVQTAPPQGERRIDDDNATPQVNPVPGRVRTTGVDDEALDLAKVQPGLSISRHQRQSSRTMFGLSPVASQSTRYSENFDSQQSDSGWGSIDMDEIDCSIDSSLVTKGNTGAAAGAGLPGDEVEEG